MINNNKTKKEEKMSFKPIKCAVCKTQPKKIDIEKVLPEFRKRVDKEYNIKIKKR